MSFFKWLFGKKKEKAEEAEIAAPVQDAIESEPEIEEAPAEEKPKKKASTPRKKPAKKENPVVDSEVADESAIAPEPPVAEPIAEEVATDQTDEEIDATFTEATPTEISAEVAQAEAKSGRALARFEIKKSKDNRFVFNLYAPNRVIVATSQIYSSSPSAVNGIRSIMVNAPKAPVEDTTLKTFTPLGFPKWEIYLDKGGQFRFRLYAPNGSCIVHSQGYTTKASCKNGIASIVKNAPDAIIDKSYLKKDKE